MAQMYSQVPEATPPVLFVEKPCLARDEMLIEFASAGQFALF
jgi:hypothetical protein